MSGQHTSGRVEQIDDSRTGVGKRGPWTLYKANISGKWISFGFDRPAFSVGQHIEFIAEDSGKGINAVKGSVRVVAGEPKAEQPKAAPPVQQPGQTTVPSIPPTDSRQMSIVMQHSQEMAERHVDLLLRNGALPISGATGKAADAKRQKEIDASVQKYVVQFYNDAISGRLLKFVADTLPVTPGSDGPIPSKKKADSDEDLSGEDGEGDAA